MARDAAPQSASTLYSEQHDPATRLGPVTARYVDALHLAAEHLAGPQVVAGLDRSAERLLNGLTGEPGWPTLRGHLLLLAAAAAVVVMAAVLGFEVIVLGLARWRGWI